MNGDGYADLAIGAPGEAAGGYAGAGVVHVLRGSTSRLTGIGARAFDRAATGIPGELTANDAFGSTVRLRDSDGDGYADLFISSRFDPNDRRQQLPSLRLPGSAGGLTTNGLTEVPRQGFVAGFLQ